MKTIENLFRKLIDPVIARRGSGKIEARESGGCIYVSITPAAGDMGRLIGKAGANFETLRTLLDYLAFRRDRRARLIILEAENGDKATSRATTENWRPDEVVNVVREFLKVAANGEQEPTDCEAFPAADEWRIETSAALPEDVGEALRRWVSIMAVATGGRAMFHYEGFAV